MRPWLNVVQMGMVMAEAQAVVGMRLMGMAGVWAVTGTEDGRMISEKTEALAKSYADASRVALRGGGGDEIVEAAIRPIRQKTRANVKRLAKRGPKTR
ncbi:antifreeze protein [Sulfitobacter sp. HNIBRBA3233]|uniref:antifreeze protein n=1 Tax=Sulfitobacter marinivivus TaxID=3158558 RepID=UPI0032E03716